MNTRKRVHPKLSDKKLVDQSQKNLVDINVIIERYRKTGMLPQFKEKFPLFIDNTGVTSVEEAHDLVQNANMLFQQIPSAVRKLMDNDPRNLIDFVSNEENREICIKYGLLEPKAVTPAKVEADKPQETQETQETQNKEVG